MFRVDCVAREGIVIRPCWNFRVGELPSGAASVHAVLLSGCDSVESITDHLPVLDDHGPHLAAGARGHR